MPGNTTLSKQQHFAQQNKTSQKHTSQNWPLFRYCYTGIEFVKSQSSLHVAAATHRDKACTALLHTEKGISRTYCATFAQFTRWEEWLRICHKVYKVFPYFFRGASGFLSDFRTWSLFHVWLRHISSALCIWWFTTQADDARYLCDIRCKCK